MQVIPFESVEAAGLYAQLKAPSYEVRFERENGIWQVRLGNKKRIQNEANSDATDGDVNCSVCS